jgi:hypothetical protein
MPAPLPAPAPALTAPIPQVRLEAPPPVATVPAEPTRRPLTVSILAVLWGVSALLYVIGAVAGLVVQSGAVAFLSVALGLFMALVSAGMAFGLFAVKPWARIAQIVLAGLGVLTCAWTPASAVTLVYMLRADAKARFANPEPRPPDPREGLFAALLLGTVLLGVLLNVGLVALSSYLSRGATVPAP